MGICTYIKEKNIKNHPNPISLDQISYIIELIKKSICLIKCPKGGHGTGFFCRIHDQNFSNFKTVLITNYHILEKDDLTEGKKIEFSIKNNTINRELIINNRKIYSNYEFDITIIELYPKKDLIDQDSFLDIDRQIFSEDPNKEFKNKDIYIIGDIKDFTYGIIKNIDINGKNIEHLCPTKNGMSGSPIINLNDHRIIGVHKGSHPKYNWNCGTFLREPIKQYYAQKDNFIDNNNKIIAPVKPYDDSEDNPINKNNHIDSFKQYYDNIDYSINDNYKNINIGTKAVTFEIGKILIEKMKTQICRIEKNFHYYTGYDTGFFCNIHYDHNNILKALIISSGYNISIGERIKFSINDGNKNYVIVMDEARRTYNDSEYGISIIELRPNDGLKEISFLEIDNNIFKNNKDFFENQRIFLLHYFRGGMSYSAGIIKRIEGNEEIIYYGCETSQGSGVGPIINSMNFQVIGVHKGKNIRNKYSIGTFLKEPILKFYNMFLLQK